MYSSNGKTCISPIPVSTSGLMDNLFVVLQNIAAGTANVSMKMLSEKCSEWKIELSPEFPVILVKFDVKWDVNERVRTMSDIDYEKTEENSETVDDKNIINQENIFLFDEGKENSSRLHNIKQEIPELLSVLHDDEEIKDKNIEDNQTKAAIPETKISTGSTSCSRNNFGENVSSSNGRKSIAVTASDLCMVILHTGEKKKGNCDDERRKRRSDILTCEDCGKNFSYLSAMIRHKRSHTGEKPFKCDHCEKSFSDSGSLIRHKRIHTGEKPFVCNVCDKSFARLDGLYYHKRIHASVKIYSCNECDKSFSRKCYLLRHRKMHPK